MKTTIRNAKKLVKELDKVDYTITVETSVEVSEADSSLEAAVADAKAKADAQVSRKLDIRTAKYAIRKAVGLVTAASDIPSLLTDAAELEDKATQLRRTFAYVEKQKNLEVVEKLFDKSRNAAESDDTKTVITSVYTQEQLDEITANILVLERKESALKDKVMELNYTTLVEIPATAQQVLDAEGISL